MPFDVDPDDLSGVTDRELLESIVRDTQRIERKLDALITAHDDMVEKVNDIIENVKPHLDDIGPVLDAIANHPMLRMFLGGKKDKKASIT